MPTRRPPDEDDPDDDDAESTVDFAAVYADDALMDRLQQEKYAEVMAAALRGEPSALHTLAALLVQWRADCDEAIPPPRVTGGVAMSTPGAASGTTRFFALMEGPSHTVVVGPFDDFEQSGVWGAAHQDTDWSYRGSVGSLSIRQWARLHGGPLP